MEITKVAGRGAGGFFGVLPLVEPGVDAKPVLASLVGHKLPQPFCTGSRESEGVQAALGSRQVDEVLGHSLLAQDAGDHRPVAARPLEHLFNKRPPIALEVGDQSFYGLMGYNGKVRLEVPDPFVDLRIPRRLVREGLFGQLFDGGRLVFLRRQAVAVFQSRQLKSMDILHQPVKGGAQPLV